jgi:hypothetical protein
MTALRRIPRAGPPQGAGCVGWVWVALGGLRCSLKAGKRQKRGMAEMFWSEL